MNQRAQTRFGGLAGAAVGAVLTFLLAAPAAWAIGPAVKEYTLQFPNAKGEAQSGGAAPEAIPLELSPATRRALSRSPNGRALATLATSPALGAPGIAPLSGSGKGPREAAAKSVPSSVVAAADDPAVITLAILLGAIVLGGLLLRTRQARSSQGP